LIASNQLCTTSFLVEVSQFIKFGDLTADEESRPVLLDPEPTLVASTSISPPSFFKDEADAIYADTESRLTNEEEDAVLRVSIFNFMPSLPVSILSRTQQEVSRTGLPVSFVGLSSY
jgi:proteasome activator subunit 4